MRYALARWSIYQREEVYRIYVTDALKEFGKFERRYVDLFEPEVQDDRTADEVINRIKSGLQNLGVQDGPIQFSSEIIS